MIAYFSSSPTARSRKFLFLASPFSGAVFAAFWMVQPLRYWLAGRRTESIGTLSRPLYQPLYQHAR
jgi:hypothetical protein